MDPIIKIDKLTKDYGEGRGIFNLDFSINEGEMLGYVGTNGSGKTTTIRNLMGFLQPTSGHAYVKGLEAWTNSSKIVKDIGYVPGEIAFPDLSTGVEFLKSQAEFLHVKDNKRANYLIEKLQLDPRAPLKRMSKGMKQKTAIVAALMADPKIIILDEPTTGLDPLMRDAFLEIINEEHKRGKTIFMSTHMFEEVNKTCDSCALIRNGKIVDIVEMSSILNRPTKEYKIEFNNTNDYQDFISKKFNITRLQEQYNQATISINKNDLNTLFNELTSKDVKFISEIKYTLEKHFKEVIEKEKKEDVQ